MAKKFKIQKKKRKKNVEKMTKKKPKQKLYH